LNDNGVAQKISVAMKLGKAFAREEASWRSTVKLIFW
jgi:hypothetical protein